MQFLSQFIAKFMLNIMSGDCERLILLLINKDCIQDTRSQMSSVTSHELHLATRRTPFPGRHLYTNIFNINFIKMKTTFQGLAPSYEYV